MDVQDDSDEPIAAINFIPMIDISLVLLIIFMVATTFVSVTGIDLKLPKASTAKNAESKSVTVQLNMQKDVFLNGEKT
ncbi:MAG: biopolymer transporter ExbD, partial [Verrucomicrobia bacterium]|nr:biopolymer transporter ExbD [Verrucomicrobiota bacterium]